MYEKRSFLQKKWLNNAKNYGLGIRSMYLCTIKNQTMRILKSGIGVGTDYGHQETETFGLGQTNWADIF